MKYRNLIMAVFIICIMNTLIYKADAKASKKSSNLELSKKYIGLASTYREAGEIDKAKEYIDKAQAILKKSKDDYWFAKSHEGMGYIYKDKSSHEKDYSNKKYFLEMSLQSMNTALSILKNSKQSYKETQAAIQNVTKQIDDLNNRIRNIDSDISKGQIYKNEYAVAFDNSKLKKFPSGIPFGIKYLSLAGNKFQAIPEEVMNFSKLEYLDLSNNKIKEISSNINELLNLKVLRLKANKLKNVPEAISEMKNLKILDLSNNNIKAIPNTLITMSNLDILDLRGNKLKFEELKKVIQNLPRTQVLHDEYILKSREAETGNSELDEAEEEIIIEE